MGVLEGMFLRLRNVGKEKFDKLDHKLKNLVN